MSDGEPVRKSHSRWFCWLVGLVVTTGMAVTLAALAPFDVVRSRLDALAGDGSADPYTPALHHRLRFGMAAVGASLIVLGAILWGSRQRLAAIGSRLREDFRRLTAWIRALSRGVTASLIVITIVAAAVRVPYLNQPMRFDEAYTYNAYSSQPWFVAISKYDAPNNHVLHSLLVLVATRVIGDAPWAVRLPAFLAGVVLVPATMLLAAAVGGRRSATLAGLLVATSSPLIEYSTNARGYTLVCLCAVCGWLMTVRLVRRCDRAAWLCWGVFAVVGCWTIPVMVYPLLMQLVWMECQCRTGVTRTVYGGSFRAWCCGVIAATAAATLVCYLPILLVSGPGSLFANDYVQPVPLGQFCLSAGGWLRDLVALLWRDVPLPVLLVCLAGLVLALQNGNEWVRQARRTALGSVSVVGLVMLLQRVLPFPRVWLFLLPLAAVLIGVGLIRWLRFLSTRPLRVVAFFATIALVATWPLMNSIRNDSIRESLETGTLPAAEAIVRDLRGLLRPGEPVITVSPSSAPLVYYARRAGLDMHHFDRPATDSAPSGDAVVVINRRHPETLTSVLGQLGLERRYGDQQFRLIKEYPSARIYRRVSQTP
jgi:hypothetical protein